MVVFAGPHSISSNHMCYRIVGFEPQAPQGGGNLRISHKNVNTMLGVFLILALCFQDEFLEDVVATSNHTVYLCQHESH